MLDRPIGISELWQDGNGVDGETLTWTPPCTEANYVTTWNETPRVLCRTSAVSTGTVFTSRRGAADLYERGAHKPVLAAPHVFTHEARAIVPRPIVESEFFSLHDDPSTNKQRDIELSEIFLKRFT